MAFDRAEFDRLLAERLAPLDAVMPEPVRTDFDLNPGAWDVEKPYARAAVLVGLVDRGDDYGVLLTLRPETMARHAGQVAFPGGRIDRGDASAAAAALREAHEEVGLVPETVRLLGQSDPYLTGTGYAVQPIVGLVPAGFEPIPDPREVAAVFETPMSFLMDPANHQLHHREFKGALRAYYAMPHNGRYIWGATAGMIKSLHDRIYGRDPT